MIVRCKMKCDGVTSGAPDDGGKVVLSPVTSGSPENDKVFKYTPGGQLMLDTINTDALAQFKEGAEYYVDIAPAQ